MGQLFKDLSIRSRLISMLIAVTVLSSLILGLVGWHSGRSALNTTIFNQLNGIRAAQAYQLEFYFRQTFAHTRSLATDRMIVNAMTQFEEGYNHGLYESLNEEENQIVSDFYDNEFVPKIATSTTNTPLSVLYQPNRSAARYFQYHYLANSPYPLGKKDGLVESKDDATIYNRFHKFYHPILRDLQNEFNYYDIFLIDIKSLSVVYSVFKEVDFGTSLQVGPYRESGLGLLANQIKANPERNLVSITDYRSYAPSYGAPASFVGAPIFDRNEAIGILAIQLSTDEINKVMTSDGNWSNNGLGDTGESYIVGSDKLMRSTSRAFEEDKASYLKTINDHGVSESTINNIDAFNTTVLLQPVVSDSIDNVFNDQTDTHLTTNYLGEEVLSAYTPLNIPGLDWAVISEMSKAEAFEQIARLQRNILIWGAVLVLGVAFISILLSRIFVRPIEKLTAGVNALRSGDANSEIVISNNDEFGDLATQFNDMTGRMRRQSAIIESKNEENEKLLNNLLPVHVVERFRNNEQTADQHQQATVLQLELDGFGEISNQFGAAQASAKLQTIIDQLDNAAERYDIQPINSTGTAYTAVCGLYNARLDHAKRTVDFSTASIAIVEQFNEEHHSQVSIRIGIDSGLVTSAVIGAQRFKFCIWGDTVDIARATRNLAPPNGVLVTQNVHERLSGYQNFHESLSVELGQLKISTHALVPSKQVINIVNKETTV